MRAKKGVPHPFARFWLGGRWPQPFAFFWRRVAYLLPARIWYLIPAFEIEGVRVIALSPHWAESRNRCNKYRERWDVLRLCRS